MVRAMDSNEADPALNQHMTMKPTASPTKDSAMLTPNERVLSPARLPIAAVLVGARPAGRLTRKRKPATRKR